MNDVDRLTGLINRDAFVQTLCQCLKRGDPAVVMVLDICDFGAINTTLGELSGDSVLRTCAERLAKALRPDDVKSRIGNDEFGVIVTAERSVDPSAIASRIIRTVAQPLMLQNALVRLGCNIGVTAALPATDADALLIEATMAMNAARATGRNHYVIFDDTMRRVADEERSLNAGSLDLERIVPVYQPIIDTTTRDIVGAEALARWRDPSGVLRSPSSFMKSAGRMGVLNLIDARIIDLVTQDAKKLFGSGIALPPLSVNVGASFFALPDAAALLDRLSLFVPNGKIELSELIDLDVKTEFLVTAVKMVRDADLRVSLDDFGSARTSFLGLENFRPDEVKLDRALLAAGSFDTRRIAVMQAMYSLGRQLGFSVVTEGIETHEQLELVRSLGGEFGQGFFLAAPMVYDEFERYLCTRR